VLLLWPRRSSLRQTSMVVLRITWLFGGVTPAAGTFTTLTANGNVVLGDAATDTVTITADVASNILPSADNTYDLGGVGAEWRNLFIDGTANIDSLVADTADINGGTIDGTVVGGSTPAAISGTTGGFSGDVSIADKIVHTGDTNTAIRFPAADTVTVETAGSERMRITSTGIVGIGTTAEIGNARLHVTDGVTVFNDGAGNPYFQLYNGNAGTDLKTWRIGGVTAGDFSVETVNDAYTAATSRMTITSAGNVGIGTNSPASILEIQGSRPYLNIDNTSGAGGDFSGIAFSTAGTTRASIEYDPGNNFLRFNGFDNTERMRITATGNVGIGTSSPTATLHVNGGFVFDLRGNFSGSQNVGTMLTATGSLGGAEFVSTGQVMRRLWHSTGRGVMRHTWV
jgi:hypothetical protein